LTIFSASRAVALQKLLSNMVIKEGGPSNIKTIIGLDVSYVKSLGIAVAAALTFPDMRLKEYVVVKGEVNIPYVPGLLAFREAPLLIKAYEKLGINADLLVIDGHGITHPRKFGIASHIGVVLDLPSIGAAKKILRGSIIRRNGNEYLVIDGEIGAVVARIGKKTIYLSIGHKVSINYIENIMNKLFKGHYLPEPTYIADHITKKERMKVVAGNKR